MGIQKFEDLIAWRKSQDLAVSIYQAFEGSKDFSFKDQIRRASVSVSNNVAEGFDRGSRPDFVRFLSFSLALCSEVKSMLYLGERLQYISMDKRDALIANAIEVAKIITGLIKVLKLVDPKK